MTATATCNGLNLDVNITVGSASFDIAGTSGPDLPHNGVGLGITSLTGPGG